MAELKTLAIFEEIDTERIRGEEKHVPFRTYALERGYCILAEEVGEVAEAVVELGVAMNKGLRSVWLRKLREELVQSGGLIISLIQTIDEGVYGDLVQ